MGKYLVQMTTTPATVNTGVPRPALAPTSAARMGSGGCEMMVGFGALEDDWRALYPIAWTDFYRFLQGWSPGHWKLHRYSERLAREVLEALDATEFQETQEEL